MHWFLLMTAIYKLLKLGFDCITKFYFRFHFDQNNEQFWSCSWLQRSQFWCPVSAPDTGWDGIWKRDLVCRREWRFGRSAETFRQRRKCKQNGFLGLHTFGMSSRICYMHTLHRNWLLCFSMVSSSLICLFHKNIIICFDNFKNVYIRNYWTVPKYEIFIYLLLYRGKIPLLVGFETVTIRSLNPHRSS